MKLVKFVWNMLRELNLFVDARTYSDPNERVLRDQRLSTRVYLVLFIASIVIFVLSTSLIEMTVRVTVDKPSFTTYYHLQATYSNTLSCPCEEISIPYSSFLSMKTTYHQVIVSLLENNVIGVIPVEFYRFAQVS